MGEYTSDYTTYGRPAQSMKDKATNAAQTMSDKAGELTERVQDSTVYASVFKAAREQPLATLAGAVAIGFMAGALWKLTRNQSTTERLAAQFSSYAEPHLRNLRKSIWG